MPARTTRRRAAVALLSAAALAAMLSGCSKTRDGAVGIGPEGDETVVVQLVTCSYPATEIQLLVDDGSEQVAEAPVAQDAGVSSTYRLVELFGTDVVEELDPGVDYRLRGRVTDEEGTRLTDTATFSLDEVSTYPDGEVSGNDVDGPATQEAFAMQACAEEDRTGKS